MARVLAALGLFGLCAALAPPGRVVVFGPGSAEMKMVSAKLMARAGFDNTKYRKSTKHISYLAHHTQSISTAITREDSRALHEALSKKTAELSRRSGGRA